MTLLAVEKLCVELDGPDGPVRLLEEVDFSLSKGECLGLVGESGCGKSLTALAIMGLLPRGMRAHGRITLNGEDLLRADEKRLCGLRGRRMAMVFQEPMTALNPVMPIGRQVAEGIRLHLDLSRSDAERRAQILLERVGLPPARFSPGLFPHQLSGGQRQRVVIAIALACGPELLVADEPTTALDVTVQAQILDLLVDIMAELEMGLILITHDLGVVAETSDRVAVMYAGNVVESGPTVEVFDHLAHPYTRGLFAAMPGHGTGGVVGSEASGRPRLPTISGRVPEPRLRPAGCPFVTRCGYATEHCCDTRPELVALGSRHGVACLNLPLSAERL